MESFTTTKTNYRITLKSNKNVDVNSVYNRIFFSSFDIDGVRIYKHGTEDEVFDDKESTFNKDKIADTFGEEKYPNGYTTLPLKKEDFEIKKEKKEEGIYGFLNSYINSYSPKVEVDTSLTEIDVTIPIDVKNPIISLENILKNEEYSIDLYIINNNIDYTSLEKIIHDLYIQIKYLYEKGFYFSEIPTSSILYVQDKYIIFDMNTIDVIKENDNEKLKLLNISFLNLVKNILNISYETTTIIEGLDKIKNTKLYYFLKRIENEGQLLWVY